jgi:hypothetical protein
MSAGEVPTRRAEDHFGMAYVIERTVKAVDELVDRIETLALKSDVALLFSRVDEKADKESTEKVLEKIDRRLTRIERNQLPPWVLGVGVIVVTVVLHFWKVT